MIYEKVSVDQSVKLMKKSRSDIVRLMAIFYPILILTASLIIFKLTPVPFLRGIWGVLILLIEGILFYIFFAKIMRNMVFAQLMGNYYLERDCRPDEYLDFIQQSAPQNAQQTGNVDAQAGVNMDLAQVYLGKRVGWATHLAAYKKNMELPLYQRYVELYTLVAIACLQDEQGSFAFLSAEIEKVQAEFKQKQDYKTKNILVSMGRRQYFEEKKGRGIFSMLFRTRHNYKRGVAICLEQLQLDQKRLAIYQEENQETALKLIESLLKEENLSKLIQVELNFLKGKVARQRGDFSQAREAYRFVASNGGKTRFVKKAEQSLAELG